MSANIHFLPIIEQQPGFEKQEFTQNGYKGIRGYWEGMDLNYVQGVWVKFTDLDRPIGPDIVPFVDYISAIVCVSFNAMGRRQFGEYEYGSAKATLDANTSNYTIHLVGKKLNDIEELIRGIRSGEIRVSRPWPMSTDAYDKQPNQSAVQDDAPPAAV